MRLTRWQPFVPAWDQLQSEVNNLFQRWGATGGNLSRSFAPTYPAVNVWEQEDDIYVEAELPGLDLKDLEIYVTGGNQLTLKGARKMAGSDKGVWHRQERGNGSFVRALTLPFSVDADKVEAHFENGVLLIKLARHENAKPRKINVKGE